MIDQNSAKFVVKNLFSLRPILAFRFVKFFQVFQAFLVGVVPQLVLQQTLIEIESFGSVLLWMGVFVEESLQDGSRLVFFLDEAENLVNFVGNDVPVLIFLVFKASLLLSLHSWQVFLVLNTHLLAFHASPSPLTVHLNWRKHLFLDQRTRFSLVGKDYGFR